MRNCFSPKQANNFLMKSPNSEQRAFSCTAAGGQTAQVFGETIWQHTAEASKGFIPSGLVIPFLEV